MLNYFKYICYLHKLLYRSQMQLSGIEDMAISIECLQNDRLRFLQHCNEQQKIADCLSSLDELITAANPKTRRPQGP